MQVFYYKSPNSVFVKILNVRAKEATYMLVTTIIGKCPGCNKENAFGNVNIHQNLLLRGCIHCKYSIRIPLPELSKKILYLDQFFLSHAFRRNLSRFVEAADIISELAHEQLIVCPYSRIHKTETLQWRHSRKDHLFQFIRETSRGHEFNPDYRIKEKQIARGFERYLRNDKERFELSIRDALPRDINNWDDYFWVDVDRRSDDIERIRESKKQSVDQLVKIFSKWRYDNTSFDQDKQTELSDAARIYLEMYFQMQQRLASGDVMALLESPIDANIVRKLLYFDEDELDIRDRLHRISHFFNSKYYYEVPCEDISSGLFSALKQKVKSGHYINEEKAKERLSGIFYDVTFISTYAPYCDAMFIDNAMIDLINEIGFNMEEKYQTLFFSKKNWNAFIAYLSRIKEQKGKEIDWGLKLVHPQ
jgi:hypothetical protein